MSIVKFGIRSHSIHNKKQVGISMRKAKIVDTIGPATSSLEVLTELVKAGMDVARINRSHGTTEEHNAVYKNIRQAAKNVGRNVAVLVDLQGPKIRCGWFEKNAEGEDKVQLEPGQQFIITTDDIIGNNIIAQTSINIEKFIPPIELVSYQYGYNGNVLEAMIKNNSDMTYTSAIIAYIYKKEGSSYNFVEWPYAWANTNDGCLHAGETAQYNISITNAMSAGNEYAIDLRYAKDFASYKTNDFLSFSTTFVTINDNGQTTGIEDIEKERNTEATDAPYYTIDGVRLTTKPTKKGLYIQNGKKMVIK